MITTNNIQKLIQRPNYVTLSKAFDATDKEHDITAHGYAGDINMSSILTAIIQDTGRFAESYASDVLFSLAEIYTLTENLPKDFRPDEPIDKLIPIGIRQLGVDHGAFIMSKLLHTQSSTLMGSYVHPDHIYRKILAVQIHISAPADSYDRVYVKATLRSIMPAINKIDPADLADEGRVLLW